MKKIQHSVISLGVLSLLFTGCNKSYLRSQITAEKVDSVALETGVELPDLKAEAYPVPVNDTLFVQSKELVGVAVEQEAALAMERKAVGVRDVIALQPSKDVGIATYVETDHPDAVQDSNLSKNKYFFVSTKMILNAFKEKLGSSYAKLSMQHSELIASKNANEKNYPELNLAYKFRANVEGRFSEYINITLKEALDGYGVFILANDQSILTYRGYSALVEKVENVKLAAGYQPKMLIDLFYPENKTEVYQLNSALFVGFQAISAGKIFALYPSHDSFKVALVGALPVVKNTDRVTLTRVNNQMVYGLAKAGYKVALNNVILNYVDFNGYVSKVFHVNSDIITKEIPCDVYSKLGYLEASRLQCVGTKYAEAVEVKTSLSVDRAVHSLQDAAVMDSVQYRK